MGLSDIPSMLRRRLAPGLLVIAVAVTTWLVTGVAVIDILKFVGYDILFVAIPGIALLWALRGRRDGALVTVALGWPVGQTLEILFFSATAAAGQRGLFILYPLVVTAASVFLIWRRRDAPTRNRDVERLSPAVLWTAAGAVALGLIYLALAFIPQVPLPSGSVSVAYHDPDFPYFIGLIAEVLHHWPATSPGLSGSPLHYEWFVFFHMAAVAQVTHTSLPIVAFRLDYVPTIVVIAIQLLAVGRWIGKSAWVGALAIVVFFLLGPLDLTTDAGGLAASPSFDLFSYHLWASWTFAFGVMFFLALIYLVSERLQATTWRTPDAARAWLLIALLMIGSSGAKATILPVLVTGMVVYITSVFLIRRERSIPGLITLVLSIGIFGATFLVVYGGGVPGTGFGPLIWVSNTGPVMLINGITNHPTLREVALPFAYLAGFAGELLPIVGILYLLRRRHRTALPPFTLCLSMLAGGILIASLVHQVSYSEEFFQDTGYVAGCIVAAAGLRLMWLDIGSAVPGSRRALTLAFAAWIVVLVGVGAATEHALHADALAIRYLVLALGAVVFVFLCAISLRVRQRPTAGILALGFIPLLAASALTSPIQVSPAVRKVLTGVAIMPTLADPQKVHGLTPGLYGALQWLQNNTTIDAVFAVNNHWTDPAETDGKYYYYAAFSERRVFVEAYDSVRYGITTGLATAAGRNFAHRQQLNDSVFNNADRNSLNILIKNYGVHYLFIDRVNGTYNPAVPGLGRVVYDTPAAIIVAVG